MSRALLPSAQPPGPRAAWHVPCNQARSTSHASRCLPASALHAAAQATLCSPPRLAEGALHGCPAGGACLPPAARLRLRQGPASPACIPIGTADPGDPARPGASALCPSRLPQQAAVAGHHRGAWPWGQVAAPGAAAAGGSCHLLADWTCQAAALFKGLSAISTAFHRCHRHAPSTRDAPARLVLGDARGIRHRDPPSLCTPNRAQQIRTLGALSSAREQQRVARHAVSPAAAHRRAPARRQARGPAQALHIAQQARREVSWLPGRRALAPP